MNESSNTLSQPNDSSIRGLFGSDNKISAWKVAELIRKDNQYMTHEETDTIFNYNPATGIWQQTGEVEIKKIVQRLLGSYANKYLVNEIIEHIKRSTYLSKSHFNPNPRYIATKNCAIDINTFDAIPFSHELKLFIRIPVTYDPNATCLKIHKFLEEVAYSKDIPILYEIIGYCLLKDYPEQKAIVIIGDGSNGKSTYLRLIQHFLGRDNCSSINLQIFDQSRFATAQLQYKLANLAADLSDKAIKDTGIFKMLTGGDSITAEHKFKPPFSFVNTAKLIFSCNKLPPVKDSSFAFFRRWIILNFPNQFTGASVDKGLLKKLTTEAELSGLLNMALHGLVRLMELSQFSYSRSHEEIRQAYIDNSDPVWAFAENMCEPDPNAHETNDNLYNAYIRFCRQRKLSTLHRTTFFRNLSRHYTLNKVRERVDGKLTYCTTGLRLKDSIHASDFDLSDFT